VKRISPLYFGAKLRVADAAARVIRPKRP
jgi:hypothetical protein